MRSELAKRLDEEKPKAEAAAQEAQERVQALRSAQQGGGARAEGVRRRRNRLACADSTVTEPTPGQGSPEMIATTLRSHCHGGGGGVERFLTRQLTAHGTCGRQHTLSRTQTRAQVEAKRKAIAEAEKAAAATQSRLSELRNSEKECAVLPDQS